MKLQIQVIDGGRDALERQIVNELFQPVPISNSLQKRIHSLKRRGKLTAVSPAILNSKITAKKCVSR